MCKQYDKLMMKNMRTSGYVDKDPNNSEFGLIKKAITIITSLEELVQHSSSYIKDAIDETSQRKKEAEQECQEMREKVEILERANDELVEQIRQLNDLDYSNKERIVEIEQEIERILEERQAER